MKLKKGDVVKIKSQERLQKESEIKSMGHIVARIKGHMVLSGMLSYCDKFLIVDSCAENSNGHMVFTVKEDEDESKWLFHEGMVEYVQQDKKPMSSLLEYEKYKLMWLAEHGYSLHDLINEVEDWAYEVMDDYGDDFPTNFGGKLELWEEDSNGFCGSIYACYGEWWLNDR